MTILQDVCEQSNLKHLLGRDLRIGSWSGGLQGLCCKDFASSFDCINVLIVL